MTSLREAFLGGVAVRAARSRLAEANESGSFLLLRGGLIEPTAPALDDMTMQ